MDKATMKKVPPLRLDLEFKEIEKELLPEIEKVLRGGHYILGPNVEAFEREFAAWNGSRFAVGVASGTDALLLALKSLGIGAGDEVITPSWSFFATSGSIAWAGAKPVFVDIDPKTYNIDPKLIAKKITKKTRAILPVHLYGHPAAMAEIMALAKENKLKVVEDCAQAHGSSIDGKKVGTFGDFGCFSCYPTKNLGACGDGGIVTTNDEALYHEVKGLHVHGEWVRYFSDKLGINSRLDEIQAAILRIKLRHLDKWLDERIAAAGRYTGLFSKVKISGVTPPYVEKACRSTFHQYILRVPQRDGLLGFLREKGISAGVYYPRPIHLQKAMSFLGYKENDLPETERASRETISLPLFHGITNEEQEYIVRSVAEFYAR